MCGKRAPAGYRASILRKGLNVLVPPMNAGLGINSCVAHATISSELVCRVLPTRLCGPPAWLVLPPA